jgi:hypothetical protein
MQPTDDPDLVEVLDHFKDRKSDGWCHFQFSKSRKLFMCVRCHALGKSKWYKEDTSLSNLNKHTNSHHPEFIVTKSKDKKQLTLHDTV